jgi:FkbM family methyltransferase
VLHWLRHELAWRRQLASRKRYLRRTFRNGEELVHSFVTRTPCGRAVCRDGAEVRHPPGRTGLALMLIEVWFEHVYTGPFFTPRPGDIIVDAGANIGAFSLLMARTEPACQVLAFEPFAENFTLLESNLRSAGAANVQAFQVALSGESGSCAMLDGGTRSQDHRLVEGGSGNASATIPTASFADVLARVGPGPIALFKCDIEGSEHDLFETASDADLRRAERYAIEFHNNIRPGTLDLLQRRLCDSHDLVVKAEGAKEEAGYGMLYATRKG